LAEQVVL